MNSARLYLILLMSVLTSMLGSAQSNSFRISNSLVTARKSAVSAAASSPDLYCMKENGWATGCWNKEEYDRRAREQGQVERQEQWNHGWDGQIAVPDYQSTDFVKAPKVERSESRINLSEQVGVTDPDTGQRLQIDLKSRPAAQLKEDVQKSLAGAAQVAMDFVERQQRATQFRQKFQRHYEAAVQMKDKYVGALRKSAQETEARSQKRSQETMKNLAMTLGAMNSDWLSQEERQALEKSREISQSDLRFSQYQLDREALEDLKERLDQAVSDEALETVARLLERLFQAQVNGQYLERPEHPAANDDGVMKLAKITGQTGPFEQREWHTALRSQEGQIVRRLANRYQRIFAQTAGLQVLSGAARARFVLGALALASADQSINTLFERGSALLKLSSLIADSIEGYGDGLGQSLHDLAMALPEIYGLVEGGVQTLFSDEADAWEAVVDFATRLPEVGGAMWLALNSDLDDLTKGSAYERSRVLGYYTVDVITFILSGGTVKVAQGVGKLGKFSRLTKTMHKTFKLADRMSPQAVEKIGHGAHDLLKVAQGVPASAREGLVSIAQRAPELSLALASSYSKLKMSKRASSTADYLQRLMAAGATHVISSDDIRRVVNFHQQIMKKMPELPRTSYSGLAARGIRKGEITDMTTGELRQLTKADAWTVPPHNQITDHRMTVGGKQGHKGQYITLGSVKNDEVIDVIRSETRARGPEELIFSEKELKVSNLLDLTDQKVLDQLRIDKATRLNNKSYLLTQAIGDAAIKNGFSGVIFYSRDNLGVKNLVLFK